MLSGISIFCFVASYTVALILEAARPWIRNRIPHRTAVCFAAAGVIAQTLFLMHRAKIGQTSPLSSPFDWYLLASWTLAALYVTLALIRPTIAIGLFLLPAILGLIGGSQFASQEPFAAERASRLWGNLHGVCLLLGTVTVILGFLAGLMYLVQSYRLKHKLLPTTGFRLPSLEWLQKINSRALFLSTGFIGVGFVSGIILNIIRHRDETDYVPWTDPLILITGAMFAYLFSAGVFSLVYRPARAGKKVAYLTVASFVFLVITLAVLVSGQTEHGNQPTQAKVTTSKNTLNSQQARIAPVSHRTGISPSLSLPVARET